MSSVPDVANCSVGFELARVGIPALMVVVGWGVVNWLQRSANARQETRKELRSRLDALDEDLRDLRTKCIEYYLDPEQGVDASTSIRVLVEDVRRQTMLVFTYFNSLPERESILDCLAAIAKAATGGTFESRIRKPLAPFDPQLTTLFFKSDSLRSALESLFLKAYPPVK